MKQSHSQLLRLTAQKNHRAFKELYDQTSPKIFSVILHFVPKKYLAEELLQEVYQEVWRRSSTYNCETSNVLSWMLEITKNKVVSSLDVKISCV